MTTINHDPFARQSTLRAITKPDGKTCDWCGGLSKRGRLFRYTIHADDNPHRPNFGRARYFCSIGCMRDFGS